MTDPGIPIAALPRVAATCGECGVPRAPDQRYCISCGVRCVPLRADLLGRVTAAGGALTPTATGASATIAATAEGRAAAFLSTLPPRTAAVAVMSMLAFGVVLGSGATSLASPGSAPLILAYAPPQPAAVAPAARAPSSAARGGGSGSGGGGGGGTTTVVQTVAAQTVTGPSAGSSSGGTGTGGGTPSPASPTGSTLPPIKHVFLIMLSGQGFKHLYGPRSAFPYLAHTLRRRGELLENYYGVAGSPLANGVALISGQGPTQQTMLNCPQYTAITPGTVGKGKQTQGDGCVYPVTAQNLPDQLTANGQTWKAYVEGMSTPAPTPAPTPTPAPPPTPTPAAGAGTTATGTGTTSTAAASTPPGSATACRHPTIGTADAAQTASTASPYVTWRNPFVYFQSIAQATTCAQQDVSLEHLATDLRHEKTTPALAYIAPSPCHDASEVSCTPGRSPDPKTAAAATDTFLTNTIAEIEASPAYRAGGLIAITADNAPQSGPQADPSACCNTPVYPNLPATPKTGTTTTTGTTSTSTTPSATNPSTSATTTTTTAMTTTSGSSSTSPTSSSTTTSLTSPTSSSTTTSSTSPTSSSTTTGSTAPAPLAGGQTTATGGGGQVGMLLLSKYVKPGSADTLDYFDHYSLLASIEQLFSLPRLGYASDPQLTLFTTGVVYNAYGG